MPKDNTSYCRAMFIVSILIFFTFSSIPVLLILPFYHFPALLSLTLHIWPSPVYPFYKTYKFVLPKHPLNSYFLYSVPPSLPSLSITPFLPILPFLLPPHSFPFFQETLTEASGYINEALGGLAFFKVTIHFISYQSHYKDLTLYQFNLNDYYTQL